MNAHRIASLLRQIGSLQMELADAYEHVEPKRKRVKQIAAPAVEPSKEAQERAARALRKVGAA